MTSKKRIRELAKTAMQIVFDGDDIPTLRFNWPRKYGSYKYEFKNGLKNLVDVDAKIITLKIPDSVRDKQTEESILDFIIHDLIHARQLIYGQLLITGNSFIWYKEPRMYKLRYDVCWRRYSFRGEDAFFIPPWEDFAEEQRAVFKAMKHFGA